MDGDNNGAMGWDDVLTVDDDFTTLPAGEYGFTVKAFERGEHTQTTGKLPDCLMAKLTIEIDGAEKGKTTITHRLYLHIQLIHR